MLSLTQYDDALGLNFKFFAHNSKVILDRIKNTRLPLGETTSTPVVL